MPADPDSADSQPGRGAWIRVLVLVVVLAGLGVAWLVLPVRDYVNVLLHWTRDLGAWGPLVVGAFYIVVCLFLLPGSVVTLAAGFLFGVALGTVTVSIGSTVGACAAFVVGRTVARDWVRQRVADRPRFRAIDRAVSDKGFRIVLLTRLSPIFPFNLQNYAYGLTGVALWKYALASWIGMLPGTVAFVYIGSGLRSLAQAATGDVEGNPATRTVFWAGLAATVVVVVLVTRIASRAVNSELQNP